jgi:DNA-directed RNA polymerase specialized sigma24 family protein
MSVSDVARHTPYLRRYARALTGSQAEGDAFVEATLERILNGGLEISVGLNPKVGLFQAFHRTWRRSLNGRSIDSPHYKVVDARLQALTAEHRTALLLMQMEGFSIADVSAILEIAEDQARARFDAARADVDHQLATQVLIIEDEPIVALDLERLVLDLGHGLAGVAATRREALSIAQQSGDLGLVLADVRLADGSSGPQAVGDILQSFDIPVIFITAFPERLLTGERPEPAFLITKPFREEVVKALIRQALFFHQRQETAAIC